jgi:hypothetical protein
MEFLKRWRRRLRDGLQITTDDAAGKREEYNQRET